MSAIQRTVDELGRIVLPADMRESLNLNAGDSVDLVLGQDCLSLRKSVPCCISCRGTKALHRLPTGKYLCQTCLDAAQ